MEESPSQKLRSHDWKPVDAELHMGHSKYKMGIEIHHFVCKECGEKSHGSSKGPTVWATYVTRHAEPMSCNDVTVKDIIV
jgi:hypothetical protein